MVKYKKQRMQRRKLDKAEAVEIIKNYAGSFGMQLVDASGVKPETLEAALMLVIDARQQLPTEHDNSVLFSENLDAHISLVLINAPRCPDCGCLMVQCLA